MKLEEFTVTDYRSITNAYKMKIYNTTVLLGKNNEGKTNVLRALKISMDYINRISMGEKNRHTYNQKSFIWNEDYPISKKESKRIKNKEICIRLDFSITDEESKELCKKITSHITKNVSVGISVSQNNSKLSIIKKGGNRDNLEKDKEKICAFICDNIDVQFVPAIRSERDAIIAIGNLINTELYNDQDDDEFKRAVEIIEKYQEDKLYALEEKLFGQLVQFLPKLKQIRINLVSKYWRPGFRGDFDVKIDDGVLTSLSKKGDGVKSLVTIALLSQVRTNKNRIIIVDEPENHLHPEAIHYIKKVLYEIPTNNQVIISTHSPIFVNRSSIESNIIVNNNLAEPANKVDDIRRILGIATSDNLQYADNIVLVEGPTDKQVLEHFIKLKCPEIESLIKTNKLMIRNIGGCNNLCYEIAGLQRYFCNFYVILDNDASGKEKMNELKTKYNIDTNKVRLIKLQKLEESELEDLINPEIYKDDLLKKHKIDVNKNIFKDKRNKWSKRIEYIANESGMTLSEEDIDNIKCLVKEKVIEHEEPFINEGERLLQNIFSDIKNDIR